MATRQLYSSQLVSAMHGGRGQRAHFANVVGGYDATESRNRRRPHPTTTMSEDSHAQERHRQIMSAGTRDLARNFAVASWAIRKHVDFVADFSFQAQTPDAGFNKYLEALWRDKCKRQNFDAASRHPHRRAIRLLEAGKTVDGDAFWLKLAPPKGDPLRGTRQMIEGDRVAMPRGSEPPNSSPEDWINGVHVDRETGRALAFGVCRRVGRTRKELVRMVPAENILQHAAYEFRVDQVRGISPVTSALNHFRDTYEGFEYALARVKLNQLFGLQVTRTADGGDGGFGGPGTTANTQDADGDGEADSAPVIDLKQPGPYVTELEPGEEIKTFDAATPSTETVAFLNLIIMIALKSLDIPFSFFDESFTNFYGSRGGLIHYLHACDNKVKDLQEFLTDDADWRFALALEDGELELPSGKELDFIKYEFVPGGVPWWDPSKEARGQAMAIAMAQTSPSRVCRETGTNFRENVDQIAEDLAYAKSKGVDLKFADSSAFGPELHVEAAAQ